MTLSVLMWYGIHSFLHTYNKQQLISRLDSRTLCPVNALGLLILNNKNNGIGDIRHIKC